MKKLLLALVLLGEGSVLAQVPTSAIPLKEAIKDFPRSQLELKTNGPVSIEITEGSRAGYEALAEMAGLNVVFDPDFRSSNTPIRIDNADILQAFDMISTRTGTFVEVLNSTTIIVAPDNQTKRRDYEVQVLKTFYLPNGTTQQRITEIITALRVTLNARFLAQSTVANAIVIRETPNQVALAEKTIAASVQVLGGIPAATNATSHILTLEAGAIHDSTPTRTALQLATTSPVSFEMNGSARASFEALAQQAGINVIFDRDFRSLSTLPFKVENVGILDAFDLLALQTKTFWEVLDGKTIIVAPDSQAKRRDFENQLVKTFYLPNASARELVEIVTAMRTLLNCRYLAVDNASNAVVIRDNPIRVSLAEKIVRDLRKSGEVTTTTGFPSGTEGGSILNRKAVRTLTAAPSPLQARVRGPFSFDMNDTARASYEAVAAMAGLRVVFDSRFQDGDVAPFKIKGVDIVDALDFLSLQTGSMWQVIDNDTIVVAPDSPSVRVDLLPQTMKTINLKNVQSTGITEIVIALRTILNVRQISTLADAIVMQDTAENIALAERIVSDLDKPASR